MGFQIIHSSARNHHVTYPCKESGDLIGSKKVARWALLFPVWKQFGHESHFEAITFFLIQCGKPKLMTI